MNLETQHPTLVITSPNGTVIKLYHPISEEYLKELLDEFLSEKKLVKNDYRNEETKITEAV